MDDAQEKRFHAIVKRFHVRLKRADTMYGSECIEAELPLDECTNRGMVSLISIAIADGFACDMITSIQDSENVFDPKSFFPKENFLALCSVIYDTCHPTSLDLAKEVHDSISEQQAKDGPIH